VTSRHLEVINRHLEVTNRHLEATSRHLETTDYKTVILLGCRCLSEVIFDMPKHLLKRSPATQRTGELKKPVLQFFSSSVIPLFT
jgi:hypothetical protein